MTIAVDLGRKATKPINQSIPWNIVVIKIWNMVVIYLEYGGNLISLEYIMVIYL